ncbi:hypothetical protein TrVE_jg10011 [Triparma verrucosa]|nr:hypothetical protein TrVE_jg10011 [Triparma verrucosa]
MTCNLLTSALPKLSPNKTDLLRSHYDSYHDSLANDSKSPPPTILCEVTLTSTSLTFKPCQPSNSSPNTNTDTDSDTDIDTYWVIVMKQPITLTCRLYFSEFPVKKSRTVGERLRGEAAGWLTVTVLEAINLKAVDINNKSNPYVKVIVTGYDMAPPRLKVRRRWKEAFEYVTEWVGNTLCPVFRGEKVTFPVLKSKGCGIRIEVWSRDDMKDKKVGSGWVGLNSLKREEERWIQLDGREGVDSGVWKVSDQTNQKHKNATVEWFAHTPLNPLHKESPHGRIKLKFELGIGMLEDCISHAWSVELAPEEEEKFEPREILRMGKDLESYIKTPIEFVQDVLAALKFKKVIRARIKDEDDTFVPFTKDDYVSYILTSSLLLLHVYYLDSTFHLFNVYLITILVRNIKNPTNTRLHKGESFKGDKNHELNGAINWLGRAVGNKGLSRAQRNFRKSVESVQDFREAFTGQDPKKTSGVIVGLILSSVVFERYGWRAWGVVATMGALFALSPGVEILIRWSGVINGFKVARSR